MVDIMPLKISRTEPIRSPTPLTIEDIVSVFRSRSISMRSVLECALSRVSNIVFARFENRTCAWRTDVF